MSAIPDQPRKVGNIVQACDSCRRKKRRCDFNAEAGRCSACERTDTQCRITHVTKPREKRKKKNMETLEGRLRSLEDLIKNSVTAKTTSPPPPPAPAQRHEQSSDNMTTSLTAHSDPPSLGTTQSNPWPTADSIPDDGTFGNTVTSQQPCDLSQYWQNSETSPSFEMPPSAVLDPTEIDLRPQVRVKGIKKCSLPPPQGGLFLLQEFLADFNTAVPLFDAESISAVFLDCYDGRADGVPITWVTVKIVLAIAHRLRAMSPLGVAQDTENVQTYLEESMAEIPGLLLTKPSLLLAQCYLGMGILLSTSSHPQHAAMLVSMSLHMLQELHVNDPPPLGDGAVPGDANQQQQQQQQQQQLQRVFWIAYSMDADISLRAGRLPTLSSRLVNVELPAEQMHDSQGEIRAAEGDFKVNVFRLRAQLALIQAQLMECVLAPRMFEAEHSHKVLLQSLVAGLEQWRANRLFELSIDNFQHLLHRSDLFHIIVLESAYLATAFTARVHLSLGTRLSVYPFGTAGLNAVLSTVAMGDLYDEARRFIGILNLLPAEGLPCNWLTLESIVSALVVLLARISQNPQTVNATADFGLAKPVLHTLYQLIDFRKDPDLTSIQHLCADLYLRTDLIVQQHNASKR